MSHPVQQCVDTIDAALKDVATTPTHFLDPARHGELLIRLHELSSRLTALELRVAADSEDVPIDTGHRDLAAWLAQQTRHDYPAAARRTRLATALDSRWSTVAAGLNEESVHLGQAEVIVAALERLPEDVDREVVRDAESALVAYAATMAPGSCACSADGSSTSSRPESVRRTRPASSNARRPAPSAVPRW